MWLYLTAWWLLATVCLCSHSDGLSVHLWALQADRRTLSFLAFFFLSLVSSSCKVASVLLRLCCSASAVLAELYSWCSSVSW